MSHSFLIVKNKNNKHSLRNCVILNFKKSFHFGEIVCLHKIEILFSVLKNKKMPPKRKRVKKSSAKLSRSDDDVFAPDDRPKKRYRAAKKISVKNEPSSPQSTSNGTFTSLDAPCSLRNKKVLVRAMQDETAKQMDAIVKPKMGQNNQTPSTKSDVIKILYFCVC